MSDVKTKYAEGLKYIKEQKKTQEAKAKAQQAGKPAAEAKSVPFTMGVTRAQFEGIESDSVPVPSDTVTQPKAGSIGGQLEDAMKSTFDSLRGKVAAPTAEQMPRVRPAGVQPAGMLYGDGGRNPLSSAQKMRGAVVDKLNNLTTKDMLNAAQKEYDDYTQSDEYKQKKQAQMAAQGAALLRDSKISSYHYAAALQQPAVEAEDAKEVELRAKRDYYQQQFNQEETQRIMEADLAEFEKWPEEDKLKLHLHIELGMGSMNQIMGSVSGEALGRAVKAQNELEEKYGADTVARMTRSVSRSKNEKLTEEMAALGKQTGDEHAVLGSTATVPLGLIGSITAPIGYLSEAIRGGKGQYPTLDPNNIGNMPNVYSGAVRGQVAQDIAGDQYDENGNLIKEGGAIRQGLSYAYQGGMSVLDSAARVVVGGGQTGALTLAAMGSFGQTMSEASKQGATPTQALILATGTAALEAATEKIPLERMLKAAKGGAKGAKAIAAEALKQAGIEATTEEVSLLGSLLMEGLVLQGESNYQNMIGEAIANGATYEEAKEQADKAVMAEALQTLAVSGFAGLFSGGGSATIGQFAGGSTQTPDGGVTGAEGGAAPQTEAVQPTPAPQAQAPTAQPVAAQETVKTPEQMVLDAATETGKQFAPPPVQKSAEQQALDELTATVFPNAQEAGQGTRQQTVEESTSVNTDPEDHTPQEQKIIDDYQESVDDNLVEYIETIKENPGKKMPRYPLKDVSDRAASDIKRITGIDVAGNKTQIESRIIEHIIKDHGENGASDRSMRDVHDIARIQYVIDNYDSIEHGGTSSAYVYQNKYGRNAKAQTVVMKKKVNGTYFVVEAVPDTSKKTVFVTSAYMSKDGTQKTAASSSGDAEASRFTPENATKNTADVTGANAPTNIIDETGTKVKGTGAAEQNFSGKAEGETGTVGAKQSQFEHKVKTSKVYDNTYKNTGYSDIHGIGRDAVREDPNIRKYDVITEAESLHEAELRTETGRDRYAEYLHLMKKDGWTGADNDTAMKLLAELRREGKTERFKELARKQREMGTQSGQMVQSFAKYSREDATIAVQDAILELDDLSIDQVVESFWKPKEKAKAETRRNESFQKWKTKVAESLLGMANEIESVEDGDAEGMRKIVRQLANLRHTTAWAGYSSELTKRTERGLAKMDFDTLKAVAKTQIAMIPQDFRKRAAGEIAKQMRVQNMLFTLTTKFKNDTGNISNGLMDAVSDSFGGRMVDALLGKITGRRTVGNDIKYAKEYTKAAMDAADVAGAFVSLDIPMELEKYGGGRSRTWSPNSGNVLVRLMSAYEKHLKYALEVSDKFYEGGAAHVVSRSLEDLGEASGLSSEQIQELAQKTGARRTFKDPGYAVSKSGQPEKGRMLAQANVGLQKTLNKIGTENIGLGDLVMPFAAVSAEVKQTGMDYTGAGMISGLKEIISIAKDAKHGKEIDPYRQRSAATNFGRGMTGAALTALFTAFAYAGMIKVHNDRESKERTMDQAQGLSGAQWNLDGSLRWLETLATGGTIEDANQAGEWQKGDELLTVDFLEPFNTQMHIGYLLSQGVPLPQAVLRGSFEALLEMPMMPTLSDMADLQRAFTEVSDGDYSGVYDAAGQMLGTVAGGIVPNWVRKTAQVVDPYYRDTYDTNPLEKAIKQTVASIPFLSKTLPKKYDNLGNEQRRYEEGDWMNAALDSLVTPWETNTYNPDPVYQEIERLNASNAAAGINVTPSQPKRKFTYTDNTGTKHEDYEMTEEEYQTLAQTQGQTAKRIVENLIKSKAYQSLTDAQKAYAIQAAYDYAQEMGKRAALPDYYSEAAAWISGTKETDTAAFIARGAYQQLDSVISKTVEDIGNGWKVSNAAKADLDSLWKSYKGVNRAVQGQIMGQAEGDTKAYLEARSGGADAAEWLRAMGKLEKVQPIKGAAGVAQWQNYSAIANAGLDSAATDAMMRAYMDDSAERKYNYARNKMGYSPAQYAWMLQVYGTEKGEGKADRVRKQWISKYKMSEQEAKNLYKLFSGDWKPWED